MMFVTKRGREGKEEEKEEEEKIGAS